MRILCCVNDSRYPYLIRGLGHVFKVLGHQFIEWDINQKPAFDAFDEYEPHIYLGSLPATSINKCLEERKGRIKYNYLHEIPYAADTFDFFGGKYYQELATDVCYIGNYEPSIHGSVFEAIESKGLNFKIFGSGRWPLPQYLGNIAVETIKNIYASSTVCLNFHSSERVYQIIASGSCPVSCDVGPPFNIHNLLIADPKNPKSYADFAEAICSTRKDYTRSKVIDEGMDTIRQGHTYFHRVSELFRGWGIENEATRVLDLYNASFKI